MESRELKVETQANTAFNPVATPEKGANPAYQILFVDDEEGVRDLMAWILSRAGFQVEVAENGRQALDMFLKSSFDLVLTDLSMPVMNGWALAQEIKSLSPHMPIGVVTGYDSTRANQIIDREVVNFIIHKPFRVEEVQNTVREFLDASTG